MTDRPDPTDPTTEAVFSSISAQAQETNRLRVDALEELVRESGADVLSDGDRDQAKDLSHQIAGSAGTFGFVRASELARQIEGLLVRAERATLNELHRLITELRRSLD